MTHRAASPSEFFTRRAGAPRRRPMSGYAMALAAAACFAVSASVAARVVRTETSPWDLSQFRIFGSFATLAVIAMIRPRGLALPRRLWVHVVAFGLLALLGTQATFYAALQRLPVAVTGWIQQVGPMVVLLVGLVLGRRSPPRSVWFASGLAFAGLYLVSGAYQFRLIRQDGIGIALALASAACFAAYFVSGERLAGLPTRVILTWGYAIAAAGWVVIDIVRRELPELPSSTARRFDLVVIVFVGTLIPTVLGTAALRRLGAAAGALTTVATPPLSGLVAWVALDERLATPRIVGGVLTLIALGWIELCDIRATMAPSSPTGGGRPSAGDGMVREQSLVRRSRRGSRMAATTPHMKDIDLLEPLASRYIDVESLPWKPTPSEGIDMKVLLEDKDSGLLTALFRWQPGAHLALHEHVEIEQTYVLEGSIQDDEGTVSAGDFVWRPTGNRHDAWSPDGALVLAFFLKPNKFLEGPLAGTLLE